MASNESDGGKGSGGAEGDVIQRKVYVHGTRGLSNDDIRWIFEHYGQACPTPNPPPLLLVMASSNQWIM